MAFDLPSARVRLGLPAGDTSKDFEITSAIRLTLTAAESYCDRKFLQETETAYFYDVTGRNIMLRRYPVTRVFEIRLDDATKTYTPADNTGRNYVWKLQHNIGLIKLRNDLYEDPEVQVLYEGGYKILPADLELGLWGIFDNAYKAFGQQTTLSSDISSISIPDIGSISFGGGGGGAGAQASLHSFLGPYIMLLEPYKNKAV